MNTLPVEKIQNIVELSKNKHMSRREIARAVGVSKTTVYKYQKKFHLV